MDAQSSPMLQALTLPGSWGELLQMLRPVFRRSSTFGLFALLATGLVARTTRRTVVGMLAGAGMAALVSFHSACRFFSHHVWDTDRLGLAVARLIVDRLVPADAAITVVVDDTLFRRWGRTVHHAFWTHDGSAQGPAKLGRGNRWVIIGIVVRLPFCSHPVCLPILFRLWAGKGAASPVELAGDMLTVLTKAFPHKRIHAVGDAAYHGRPLLVPGTTITTRLPANAALFAPAPPRTGRRGRPAKKGQKLPRLSDLAATATWRTVTVHRYGRVDTVQVAVTDCLWYGAFADAPGRAVLVRDPDTTTGYELALFTTDRHATPSASWHATPSAGRSNPPTRSASNCSASVRPATAYHAPWNAPCRSGSSPRPSSSSGTPCSATTPTTSPPAMPPNPGTPTRPSPPSKTCSPSSAAPSSPPDFPRLHQNGPTPT